MGNPLAGCVPLVELALPWRDVRPMDVKMRISQALQSGGFAFHELCAFLRISLKTGYKWVRRWEEQRQAGSKPVAYSPLVPPTNAGGRGAVQQRRLVKPRRRWSRPGEPGLVRPTMSYPNSVWTADFKGPFTMLDGKWCYPLTRAGGFSRSCLAYVGIWHIRPYACNIEGTAVGHAVGRSHASTSCPVGTPRDKISEGRSPTIDTPPCSVSPPSVSILR